MITLQIYAHLMHFNKLKVIKSAFKEYIFIITMYLGQNISTLMNRHKMSRKDLADKLDVNPVQIGKYLKETSFPRVEGLITIAEIFNVNMHDLIMLDLSNEQARPFGGVEKESGDKNIAKVNDALLNYVTVLENAIKTKDPELARELGIK